MRVVGVTGSMASGKTTLSRALKIRGVSVFDADKTVHRLINREALPILAKEFPQAVEKVKQQTRINRKALSKIVFADTTAFRRLERILHPMVRREMVAFIKIERLRRAPYVILDIPLLFENHLQNYCDVIVLADVPSYVQQMRLERIRQLSESDRRALLSRQMPLWHKRKKADIVIAMNQPLGIIKRKAKQRVKRYFAS